MAATSSVSAKSSSFFGKPHTIFWLLLAYFVLSVILRLVRSDALQPDEAEQIFQSQYLLMGYGRQPPFYNWLQIGIFELVGPSILGLSLLKNGLLALTCIIFGLAARTVAKDRDMGAAAMLGVLTMPATIVMVQRDLTHAIALFCFVALFLLTFFRTLTKPSLLAYLATGVVVGLGIITKYNFVILPAAAIIAALSDADLRKRVFDWRLIPALVVAGLICLPHMLWVLHNLDAATSGTISAMHDDSSGNALFDRITGLLSIIISALQGTIPTLIFFAIAFPGQIRAAWQAENRWTRLTGITLIACLAIVAVIALGFGASSIRQKWLAPFLMLFPLYLCMKLDAAGVEARIGLKRLAIAVLSVATLFIVYLFAANALGPLFGKQGKETVPYYAFVERILAENGNERPTVIVTDNAYLGGAARILLPNALLRLPSERTLADATPTPAAGSTLVLWTGENPDAETQTPPTELMEMLANYGIAADAPAKTMAVPYQFSGGAKSAKFSYMWLPAR
ncbi:glycosyltransferase [Rhizobiales bacterium RZME27]|uniref:Glycosyltransferase n=1 Tax=Endobacterium cereale TaxID=2663029 RepID=A0A6A8A795_9HYPH|nr:glycosyltransferase family 39 protein [Endobacterium cereale]MEB2846271.1 glycosyltransferase family 39 protein [Endobacterium cereale]MQY45707.1 glycosyltransferase [Endobacterium cereale]